MSRYVLCNYVNLLKGEEPEEKYAARGTKRGLHIDKCQQGRAMIRQFMCSLESSDMIHAKSQRVESYVV